MYTVTAKDEERLLKGTTTIGIVAKDGVVLATERRATAGTMIANKSTNKLFKIDQNIGMTVAGLVGDAQVSGATSARRSPSTGSGGALRSAPREPRRSSRTSSAGTGCSPTTPG